MSEALRNFPRYATRLSCLYEVFGGPPGEQHHGAELLDVGLRGCRLSTGARTELSGLRLQVHLVLGAERLTIPGTIVWTRPGKLGPSGEVVEPGSVGISLEPPIPRAYAELVAELASKQPALAAPPHTQRPRPPTPRAQPHVERAMRKGCEPTDRLRTALRTGRDRRSSPPQPATDAAPGGDRACDSLGLLPPAPAEAQSAARRESAPAVPPAGAVSSPPPAPAQQIDELLLDFLIETKTGASPRPVPVDAMLVEFLADVQTGSRHRPAGVAERVSDQDIDALLATLSEHECALLDQVCSVIRSGPQGVETETASSRSAVLVVDDDPAALEAHARELGLVFQVVPARSLEEAFAVLDSPGFELCAVVCDLEIRGDASAGVVLQQQVGKRLPRCARILVSGLLRDDLAGVYELEGVAQRALGKPCQPGQLLQALQDILLAAAGSRCQG